MSLHTAPRRTICPISAFTVGGGLGELGKRPRSQQKGKGAGEQGPGEGTIKGLGLNLLRRVS